MIIMCFNFWIGSMQCFPKRLIYINILYIYIYIYIYIYSNNVIYLFKCKKYQFKFPYVGSTNTNYHYYQVVCCVVTICFVFDGARLSRGLDVWEISDDVKNKRNGGSHEVDEIDDNTFIYIYVHLLFIYLFVCFFYLFICLFNYLFI